MTRSRPVHHRLQLEAALIGQLPAVNGRRTEYADTLRPGLVLRVTPAGARTWVLRYRAGARVRRYRLGWWPRTSLSEARKRAKAARGAVDAGQDPQALRGAERAAQRAAIRGGLVMETVLDRFAAHIAATASPSVRYQWPRIIAAELQPAIGRIAPGDPELRARVVEAAERVSSRGSPAMANRVLQIARRAWRWGVERALIPADAPYPLFGLRPLHRERPRTRHYSPDEIRALWAALEREGPVSRGFGRLLWWTAARSVEVATMRFEEVDPDSGRWRKTATKTREPLVLTLPRQARWLIEGRRARFGSGLVLPSARRGTALPFSTRHRLAERLRAVVPDYRHHDVRRTVRTGLAELGVRYEIAEMVLGHSRGAITETYDRHLYQGEIAEALQRWADRLDSLTSTR